MNRFYQLGGFLQNFGQDFQAFGSNPFTPGGMAAMGLNLFANNISERVNDSAAKSYQNQWLRTHGQPSNIVNPYAYGNPNLMRSGGIHIKPENRGKFTAYKKRTGKTTEEALHSPNAHVRQMANFARNAKKWKHWDGGDVDLDHQDWGNGYGLYDDATMTGHNPVFQLGGLTNNAVYSNYIPEYMIGGPIPFGYRLSHRNGQLYKAQEGGFVANTPEDQAMGYFKYPNASYIEFPGSGQRTFVPGPFPIAITDNKGTQILRDKAVKTYGKVTEKKIYQQGGEVVRTTAQEADPEEATIEAEKGEYILGTGLPGGATAGSNIGVGLYYIGGNKHYNGGTKLAASPGDFIFSDDKDLAFSKEDAKDLVGKEIKKAKDRTPAALVGRYKDFNKFIDTAQDSKAMPIDRKTAMLNIENVYDKLADIAIGQELFKGLPNGIPDFAKASIEKRNQPTDQTEESLDAEALQQNAAIPQAKYGGKMRYQQGGALPMTSRSSYYNRGPITANPGELYYTPFGGVQRANVPHTFNQNINDDGYTNLPTIEIPYPGISQNPDSPYLWWNQYKFPPAQQEPFTAGPMDRNVWSQTREDYALPQDFGLPTNDTGTTMNDTGAPVPMDTPDVPYEWTNLPNDTIRPPENKVPSISASIGTIPMEIGATGPTRPANVPIESRSYNSQVNLNPAELYGLIAANKRYPSRYPTAQRFYEGDNIDAILTSANKPLSAAPYLANIQRQVNTFNANNSGYGPQSYARNAYAFTQALNAQNQAIGQVEGQNTQRQDQLAQALAQNQGTKGQMRLNLQDKYFRELETVKNNQELASKNRMAQTSNLLNAYQKRAMEQKYSNAMLDNFQLDANGNLQATPPKSLKNAILNSTSGSQMSSQLNYLEQMFKLMNRYGIKGTGFVDDALKPITNGR